jgi:putative endonuclease
MTSWLTRPSPRSLAALRGQAAEQVAADSYRARGFELLRRNLRVGAYEIDLLARQGALVVVVEVRTRKPGALVPAFASVGAPKMRRLRAAVQLLWARLRHDPTIERIRVDVAAVHLDRTPVEIEIAEAIL